MAIRVQSLAPKNTLQFRDNSVCLGDGVCTSQAQPQVSISQNSSSQVTQAYQISEPLGKLTKAALWIAGKAIKAVFKFIGNIAGMILGFVALSVSAFFLGKYALSQLKNHLKAKAETWKNEFSKNTNDWQKSALNNFSDWLGKQHNKLETTIQEHKNQNDSYKLPAEIVGFLEKHILTNIKELREQIEALKQVPRAAIN